MAGPIRPLATAVMLVLGLGGGDAPTPIVRPPWLKELFDVEVERSKNKPFGAPQRHSSRRFRAICRFDVEAYNAAGKGERERRESLLRASFHRASPAKKAARKREKAARRRNR